jgi:hypothetical protein
MFDRVIIAANIAEKIIIGVRRKHFNDYIYIFIHFQKEK